MTDWTGKAGIYLVAYGRHAHDCAYHLIASIHKYSPGIPICLVCEGFEKDYRKPADPLPRWSPTPVPEGFKKRLLADDIVIPSAMRDRRARYQKTKIWSLAPAEWELVLYMDVDMLVKTKLDAFFNILSDGWEMVVTLSPPDAALVHHAQRRKYEAENLFTNKALGGDRWLQIAGGVWAWRRCEATETLLKTFHTEWRRFKHTDQQAMMRALWKCPVRMWTFGTEWNTFVHKRDYKRSVGIYHFATAARAWVVKHQGRKLWREMSAQFREKE
ncbi:MAG TPA: hypothetical protein VMW24_24730 [Sedimentisphaerales bacterium]|nr:hypothetical protein [Sedimentisphaerales bacterium]